MIYEKFALYYDQFLDHKLYDVYYNLITKYHKEGTVLDLGTGTAPLAIKLAKQNFFVTGTDTSEYMLEQAYNNAVLADVHINLFIHDILDPLPQDYDVVTMTSDVINYMKDETEMIKAFNNVKNAMNKDSIFVFDFLRISYLNKIDNYKEDILLEDELLEWNVVKTNLENQIKHTLKFGKTKEVHYQKTFTLKKFRDMLNSAGLEIKSKHKTDERIILLCKLK